MPIYVKSKHKIVISGDPKFDEAKTAPNSAIKPGDLVYLVDPDTVDTTPKGR